jgi:hypothetical protein
LVPALAEQIVAANQWATFIDFVERPRGLC